MEASESMAIVDKLTGLDLKAATTAGDIAEGLSQFANLASMNGIDIDQAAAYVATIADVSQKSGATVGQSLKTIISRYGNVKAGAYGELNVNTETEDGENSLNDVERVMKKIGISIRDTNLQFKDFDAVLDELADKWQNLDNVSKNAIASAFAGTRQREAFVTLMENYSRYEDFVDVSRNSGGTAEKKFNAYRESIQANLNELTAIIQGLINDADFASLIKFGIDAAKIVAKNLPIILKVLTQLYLASQIPSMVQGNSVWQQIGRLGMKPVSGIANMSTGFARLFSKKKIPTDISELMTEQSAKEVVKEIKKESKSGKSSSTNASPAVKKQLKASKGQVAGAMISYALNQATSAIVAYTTSGNQHTYKGYSIENSSEAKKAAKSTSAAFAAAIPGFGQFIGEYVGNKQAKRIDRLRDVSYYQTQEANKRISGLNAVSEYINSINNNLGTEEALNGVDKLMSSLYGGSTSEEIKQNKQTRSTLEDYLNRILNKQDENRLTLQQAGQEIKQGNKEVAKALLIAQKRALAQETINSKQTQLYEAEEDLTKAYSSYRKASGNRISYSHAKGIGSGIGSGIGTAAAVGLGSAAVGAIIGGQIGSVIPIVGTAIGVVAGAVIGTLVGRSITKAEKKEAERKAQESWSQQTYLEKINSLWESREAAITEGNSKLVTSIDNLIIALNDQKALIKQINDEIDNLKIDETISSAKDSNGRYLTDLNIQQLKRLGPEELINIIAENLGENALVNTQLYDSNGQLTDDARAKIIAKLKEDSEIASVISGQSYTLSEALALNDRENYNNTEWMNGVLSNFSTYLGVTLDKLKDEEAIYGLLTLSDLMMTSAEQAEAIDELNTVMTNLTTSAGQMSDVITEIISKYPQLMEFMSSSQDLFEAMLKLAENRANAFVLSQYRSMSESTEFGDAIINKIFETLPQYKDQIIDFGATSIDDLIDWIKNNGEAGEEVLEVLKEITDEYTVISDNMKETYDLAINYQVNVLDKQLTNLQEQKSTLENINSQREYENELVQARINLENAQKEKKRVYRAGVGFVYTEDQEAVKEAQEKLDELNNQKLISSLEVQIKDLEGQKNDLQNIWNLKNEQTLSEFYDAFSKTFNIEGGMNSVIDALGQGGIIVTKLDELIQNTASEEARERQEDRNNLESSWKALAEAASGEDAVAYNSALNNFIEAYNTAKNNKSIVDDDELLTKLGAIAISSNFVPSKYGELSASEVAEYGDLLATSPSYQFNVHGAGSTRGAYTYSGKTTLQNAQVSIQDAIYKKLKKGGDDITIATTDGSYDTKGIFGWQSDFSSLSDYGAFLSNTYGYNEFLLFDEANGKALFYKDGSYYQVDGGLVQDKKGGGDLSFFEQVKGYASGTLGSKGGLSFINELGTEALVTPQGTLTSLPSGTGVVPAELTKNLWELGEIAPYLSQLLKANIAPDTIGKSIFSSSTDESFNINNLTMNVNADSGFDVDEFVKSIKARVNLTKNIK